MSKDRAIALIGGAALAACAYGTGSVTDGLTAHIVCLELTRSSSTHSTALQVPMPVEGAIMLAEYRHCISIHMVLAPEPNSGYNWRSPY